MQIDSEIAEIIKVKIGTRHLKIYILHRGRKIISILKEETLTSIISAISESVFYIFVPIKTLPTLAVQISRSQQINKVETQLWDILYVDALPYLHPSVNAHHIFIFIYVRAGGAISPSARVQFYEAKHPLRLGARQQKAAAGSER